MLGVGVHESSGDEPPDLTPKHLVAVHGTGGDDATDVEQSSDPNLLRSTRRCSASIRASVTGGMTFIPASRFDPLPMKHVMADGRDVVEILVDRAQEIFPDGRPSSPRARFHRQIPTRRGSWRFTFPSLDWVRESSTSLAGVQQNAQGNRQPAIDHPRPVSTEIENIAVK